MSTKVKIKMTILSVLLGILILPLISFILEKAFYYGLLVGKILRNL